MADTFYPIDKNTTGGAQAANIRNLGIAFGDQLATFVAQMSNMKDGADYTGLEAYCGLQAGDGSAFFALFNGVLTQWNASTFKPDFDYLKARTG